MKFMKCVKGQIVCWKIKFGGSIMNKKFIISILIVAVLAVAKIANVKYIENRE